MLSKVPGVDSVEVFFESRTASCKVEKGLDRKLLLAALEGSQFSATVKDAGAGKGKTEPPDGG